ncbi:MAG: hypothetical protein O3A87_05925 [Verrucomicrobia bacterium]|nr:hypothetical protein [Verrucomicrobiota bacterium]MDA1006006.1 hypothetical protein [Verrucomicrobiota bacterium]
MPRKRLIIALLLLGFTAGWLTRSMMRPSYPDHWNLLQLGMTAQQAKGAVPTLDRSLRDAKGFDQTGIDYGKSYWQLQVSYDDETRVSRIEKSYVNRGLGFFNKSVVTDSP